MVADVTVIIKRGVNILKQVVCAFYEHKEFPKDRPWSLLEVNSPGQVNKPVVTFPHYAETIEMILTDGTFGDTYIGGKRYTIQGKSAFFIPPNVVHSMNYETGDNPILCAKLYPAGILPYLDLERVLSSVRLNFMSFSVVQDYDTLLRILLKLNRQNDTSMLEKLSDILMLFSSLRYSEEDSVSSGTFSDGNFNLNSLIAWTEEHLKERIPLDDVAFRFGYSKTYFCELFKLSTGTTYLEYVNHLRISYACRMLKCGYSTKEVCKELGFRNESYFIRLFRKFTDTTPFHYADGKE